MENSERRKFVRLNSKNLIKHIKFIIPGMDLFPTKKAFSKDIGGGGVLFRSDHLYNPGDVIRMELHVPVDPEPVLALAKVVRVLDLGEGNYDIGVCFVGIDDGHQAALVKFIREHISK